MWTPVLCPQATSDLGQIRSSVGPLPPMNPSAAICIRMYGKKMQNASIKPFGECLSTHLNNLFIKKFKQIKKFMGKCVYWYQI
jgi:hypothetical protein